MQAVFIRVHATGPESVPRIVNVNAIEEVVKYGDRAKIFTLAGTNSMIAVQESYEEVCQLIAQAVGPAHALATDEDVAAYNPDSRNALPESAVVPTDREPTLPKALKKCKGCGKLVPRTIRLSDYRDYYDGNYCPECFSERTGTPIEDL